MKKLFIPVLLALVFLLPRQLNAMVIVDTGMSILTTNKTLHENPFAAEFTLTQDYTITDIWGCFYLTYGNFTVRLYEDDAIGGQVPGTLINSQDCYVGVYHNAWAGVSNISWNLAQGTYWVSFAGATANDAGGMVLNPPDPLNYAYYLSNFAGYTLNMWVPNDDIPICVKIQGTPAAAAIPEPGISLLLGLGLAGLAVVKRKCLRTA